MIALIPGREMQRCRCTFPFEHQNKFVHRDQIKRVVKFGCSAGEHNKRDTIYGKKIWFKCNTVVLADGLNTSNMHIAYEIMLRNHIPCYTKEKEPYTMPLQRRKRWKKMVIMFSRESKSINAVFMVNILMSSKCTQSKGLGSDAYTFWHLLLSRSRNRSFFLNE